MEELTILIKLDKAGLIEGNKALEAWKARLQAEVAIRYEELKSRKETS